MANEGILAVKATAPKYLKGAADQTIRKRPLLGMLQQYGRLKLGEEGSHITKWSIKVREPEIKEYGDSQRQVFNEHDAYEQLSIDNRAFIGTDKLSHLASNVNQGKNAIVVHYDEKLPALVNAARHTISKGLYADGYAGNQRSLIGLGSFFKPDATVATNDLIAVPAATAMYGGKSVALQTFGGTWSTDMATSPSSVAAVDWPYGQGDSEFDALTPKMFNAQSNQWPGSGTTFKDNVAYMMSLAKLTTRSLGGDGSEPLLHLLCTEYYNDFQNHWAPIERIHLQHQDGADYGFPNTLNYEGAMVSTDYDVPSAKGYALNIEEMLLYTLTPDLFFSEGPVWSTEHQAYLFVVGFHGNYRFNPKHFVQYGVYGS